MCTTYTFKKHSGHFSVYKLIRRKPFLDINGLVLKDSSVPKSEHKPYLDYAPFRVSKLHILEIGFAPKPLNVNNLYDSNEA